MKGNNVFSSAMVPFWIFLGLLLRSEGVTAQSIGGGQSQLNVLFLVEAVAVWVVVIGIFFFWNRLVGAVVGFFLRSVLWRSQHVWISFESLQFSPLSGRILFKNLRYHSSNMSLRILKGHATWQFWKWNVRTEGPLDNLSLPCRCSIYVEGLEWFLYNRTPAYDAIVERMKASTGPIPTSIPQTDLKAQSTSSSQPRQRWWRGHKHSPPDQHDEENPIQDSNRPRPLSPPIPPSARLRERLRKSRRPEEQKAEWNWARDLLPVEIIVDTGAVVVGSDATPTVTIAEFKTGNGTYEATESRSKLDLYKQLARFNFTQVKVLVRTNPDFTGVLLEHGRRAYDEVVKDDHSLLHKAPAEFTARTAFHDLAKRFAWMRDGSFAKPPSYAAAYYGPDNEWKGLARYRNVDGKEMRPQTLQEIDYAKVATLLDTPALDLEYYVDVPGVVPADCKVGNGFTKDCVGNGDIGPEWGIDVVTHGGFLTYGPWADRQRDAIMRAFTPSIFFHSDPTPHLRVGDKRMHTELKVCIELMDETVLRMPTREASKDWEYPRQNGPPVERKFGWLDLKIGTSSFIQYTMPIVATPEGYSTTLELGLHNLSVSSHVNYDTFLHADSCRVTAKMPTPLQWDARRDWQFDITMSQPVITLLRDHITLISDLAKDWNSGPQGDFFHFTPYDYQFKVTLSHYRLKLYVNDFNVVDYPNRDDENAFLILHGDELSSDIEVPAIRFRPESTTIPFSIRGSDVLLDMSVPGWHTQNSFGTAGPRKIGKIGTLDVRSTYLYYSSVSSNHVETISLFIHIDSVSFHMLGWAIRRMILIKENYFGTFTHFRTFGELVEDWDKVPKVFGDRVEEKYTPGKSDAFEVNLEFYCTNGIIIAPENIYTCGGGTACGGGAIIPIPELQLHLRSNTDYMELIASAPPLAVGYLEHTGDVFHKTCLPSGGLKETLQIDGLRITANRLFGPPPRNSTYLCLWDFEVGSISGQCGLPLLHRLAGVKRAFTTTYADVENAPAAVYNPPTDPDVTFLRLAVRSLGITIQQGHSEVVITMPAGLSVGINTLAGQAYYSVVSVTVPEIYLSLMMALAQSYEAYCEIASASGAVEFDLFGTPRGWQDKATMQQAFITAQDSATRRLKDLYAHHGEIQGTSKETFPRVALRHSPFDLPNPVMPWTREEESSDDESSSEDDNEESSQADTKDEGYQSSASSLNFSTEWPIRTTSGVGPFDSDSGSSSDSDSAPSTVDSTVPLRDTLHEKGDLTDPEAEPQGHVRIPADLLKVLKLFRKVEGSTSSTFEPINQSTPEDLYDVDSASEIFPNAASEALVGECTTFIRVRTPRAVRLLVTPSAIPAGIEYSNAWGDLSRVESPETRLDRLLSDQISAVSSHSKDISRMCLDLRLPDVTVKILQQSSVPSSNGQITETLLSTELLIRHLGVKMSSTSGESLDNGLIAKAAAHMVSLGMSASPSVQSGRSPATRMLYLECGLTGPKAFYGTSKHFDCSGGLHLGDANLSVEPILATAISAIVLPWKTALYDFGPRTTIPPDRDLQFVHALLAGPTSTYRLGDDPRYWGWKCDLLRSPTSQDEPNNLRDNAGWKVLSRLRHLLRKRTDLDTVGRSTQMSQDQLEMIRQELIEALLCFREDYGQEDLEQLPFLQTSVQRQHSASPSGKDLGSVCFVLSYTQLVLRAQELDAPHPVGELTTQSVVSTIKLVRPEALSPNADGVIDINVSVGLIQLETYPSALATVSGLQVISPANAQEAESATSASTKVSSTQQGTRTGHIIMAVAIDRSIFALNAHTLRCEVEGHQAKFTGALALIPSDRRFGGSGKSQLNGHDIALTANLSSGMIVLKGEGEELISLALQETLAQVVAQESPRQRIDLVTRCQKISFKSLKDPKAVYQTITVWRREHLAEYEATLKSLLQDDGTCKKTTPSLPVNKSRIGPIYSLDIVIKRLSFTVGISRKSWVFWHLNDIYAHANQTGSAEMSSGEQIESGLKIGSQTSGFSQDLALATRGEDTEHANAIRIPCMAAVVGVAISPDSIRVRGSLNIDPFIGTFKPTVLDRILSTYKALGHDVRSLALFGETLMRKEDTASPVEPSPTVTKRTLVYSLRVESQGIRVRLRASGVSSMLTVQASSIGGWVTNCGQDLENTSINSAKNAFELTSWDVSVEGLRLSTGIATISKQSKVDRDSKPLVTETAFMVLDIGLSQRAHKDDSLQDDLTQVMHVHGRMAKAHAVVQVTALSQVYDMLNSWSDDMRAVRERRAKEWTDIVQETSKFIKPEVKPTPAERQDWLEKHTISLEISGVAVAIPLSLDHAAILGQNAASSGSQATPALLFSIGEVQAINKRGQVGRAEVKDVLMQFMREFDATNTEHFQGLHHSSGNRMHLPSTVFESRLRTDNTSRTVWLRGVFSGFELRLDTNVIDYTRLLLEVYRQGRDSIEQLVEGYPIEAQLSPSMDDTPVQPSGKKLSFRTSLDFYSGRVCLYQVMESDVQEMISIAGHRASLQPLDRSKRTLSSADIIILPGISTWIEHHSGGPDTMGLDAAPRCMISAVIHSSENTLRPSLIPFIDAIALRLRAGGVTASIARMGAQDIRLLEGKEAARTVSVPPNSAMTSSQLSLSLRIDPSTLDLSCQPDSPVLAGIAWQGGGFTLQKGSFSHKIALTAHVAGVSLRSRHAYLTNQESVSAGIKDLNATAVWDLMPASDDQPQLELLIDSSMAADIKLQRFQDLLCLQAVWVDRMPVLEMASKELPDSRPVSKTPSPTPPRRIVIVRVRHVDISADLVVSRVNLSMEPVVFRADLHASQDIFVNVQKLELCASGSISGSIKTSAIAFHAVRKARQVQALGDSTLLAISLDIDAILAQVDIEGQRIADLRLLPTNVTLQDDWTGFDEFTTDQPLELAFSVKAGAIDGVLSVLGLPGLLDSVDRVKKAYQDQKVHALAESKAYRQYREAKPVNAFASVAVAMQESVRQRQSAATDGKKFKVVQALHLETHRIRIALYKTSDYSESFYRLDLATLAADFNRDFAIGGYPLRNLTSKLEGVRLRRFTPRGMSRVLVESVDVGAWMEKASSGTELRVISLPNTTVIMSSLEDTRHRSLSYDYSVAYAPGSQGRLELDFQLGVFIEIRNLYRSLLTAIKRVEETSTAEAKAADTESGQAPSPDPDSLTYLPGKVELRPPQMNILGDFSEDLLGSYTEKWLNLAPELTHTFVTAFLENGMDVLLGVYENMLPT